jgi:hypothetical protein
MKDSMSNKVIKALFGVLFASVMSVQSLSAKTSDEVRLIVKFKEPAQPLAQNNSVRLINHKNCQKN